MMKRVIDRSRRRVLVAAIGAVALLSLPAAAPADARMLEEGTTIVQTITTKFLKVYADQKKPLAAKEREFSTLFNEHFDFKTVGKWVMGRPWRTATPTQRQEYVEYFRHYIVKTYVVQIGAFAGETIKVLDAKPDGKGVAVNSQIIRPGKRPIDIKWRLRKRKSSNQLKVRDVVIDNISMALNQRREFASVYQKRGSTVDGLIAAMKEKIAELDRKK